MAVIFVVVTAIVSGVGVLVYKIFSKRHAERKRAEAKRKQAEADTEGDG
jgi:Ni/Fe-hydrogenase subunit HybB-like protein